MNVVVRGGDLQPIAEATRETVWAIDPMLPVERLNTVEDQAGTTIVTERFYAGLLGGVAGVAFFLAVAGIKRSRVAGRARAERVLHTGATSCACDSGGGVAIGVRAFPARMP